MASDPGVHAGLAGKHILVVEDEYFIAADLKRALTGCEAIVIGPAGDLDDGLALLGDGPLDAAVLDVNLDGTRSFPIAARLADRAVPFLFVTGYDGWALPDEYRAVPRIAKPFTMHRVLTEIQRLIEEARS